MVSICGLDLSTKHQVVIINNFDATQISIKDFLEKQGIETRKEGNKYFCSSPFSTDTNWSFVIYPTNTYFDFSTGHGGNILNLVSKLENISTSEASKKLREGSEFITYEKANKDSGAQSKQDKPFNYKKYINTNPEECEQIKAYAASRGITEGYFCGVFFTRLSLENQNKRGSSNWVRVPALGFLHVNKDLKPCGAKFRRIDGKEPRFNARGTLGWYLLPTKQMESILSCPTLYVVESESSANSLMMYMQGVQKPAIILSRGGVSAAPSKLDLPEKYRDLSIKLIIDYDGNEGLYQQRLALYKDLGAEPIKLILPKGSDINSLYCENKMWLVEQLLLQ